MRLPHKAHAHPDAGQRAERGEREDWVSIQTAEAFRSEVELRNHDWPEPLSSDRVCEDQAFLDMCLSPRPTPARGRYVDRWPPGRIEPIGPILFIPPRMTLNGSCGAGTQTSLSCFIDGRYFESALEDLNDRALVECLDVKNIDVLKGLQRLLQEKLHPDLASPIFMEGLLIAVSVDLIRHLRNVKMRKAGPSGLAPWRMRLIEDRIRSEGPMPSVAELADLCRMSRRHLARTFRNESGGTLKDRIKGAGLARAHQMLADEDAPIKQIAADLGFAGTSSFSSAFLRATGMRPTDARTRGRSGVRTDGRESNRVSSPKLAKPWWS